MLAGLSEMIRRDTLAFEAAPTLIQLPTEAPAVDWIDDEFGYVRQSERPRPKAPPLSPLEARALLLSRYHRLNFAVSLGWLR